MNHDKLKFWLILFLFPIVYYGIAVSYSYYGIFALGHYEPKFGQWITFQIAATFDGYVACIAFIFYLIGLRLLKTASHQLPRPRLALITVTSAFLSFAVLLAMEVIGPNIFPDLFNLVVLCLSPAILGVSLVKIGQCRLASHQPIQR
jgi:hypothetical protein